MGCPDEDALDRFARGELDDASEVEAHIDGCEACAQVVAELALAFDSVAIEVTAGTPPRELTVLPAGATVDRYRIRECVGTGAMGIVYRAHDQVLDRTVAVKFLHRAPDRRLASEGRERLEREALALARLSHPNVVAVHDVGTYEGHLFVAMEFVEGVTLTRWLEDGRRSTRDILRVFVEAGRGLAAAHDAGLVHRDFKPDNVLVGPRTPDRRIGRVRVTDFGLARLGEELESQFDEEDSANRIGTSLTQTGAIVGTPAFCSPEQFEGKTVGPRSDQFSFCVALYRALFRTAPFPGTSLPELSRAVTAGELQAMPAGPVPRRIRAALRRGLSVDPMARFESMHALLATLGTRRGNVWRAAAIVTAVGAVASGWAIYRTQDHEALPLCEDKLERVWNRARAKRIGAAFEGSGVVYAGEAWNRASARLDAYAAEFSTTLRSTCSPEALSERGSGETLVRVLCLESTRAEAEALLDALERPEKDTITRAVAAVSALPDPARCREAAPPPAKVDPPSAEDQETVEEARAKIVEARALGRAGRYEEQHRVATEAVRLAELTEHAPTKAEALSGLAASVINEPGEGIRALREAAYMATAARHHLVAAKCWSALVYNLAVQEDDTEAAQEASRLAWAELDALGGDEEIEAGLLTNLGAVAHARGETDAALKWFEQAMELRRKLGDPLREADLEFNIVTILFLEDHLDEAEPRLQDLIATFDELLGPSHPELAVVHMTLGQLRLRADRPQEALPELERAAAIVAAFPGTSPSPGQIDAEMAEAQLQLGDLDRAESLARRALDSLTESLGPEHHTTAYANQILADILREKGELDEAEQRARAAVQAFEERGTQHLATALGTLAWVQAEADKLDEARATMERSVEVVDRLMGPAHSNSAIARAKLADILLDLGKPELALTRIDEALTHVELWRRPVPTEVVLRFCRARAKWALGDEATALDDARAALARAREIGPQYTDEIEAWLAEHEA